MIELQGECHCGNITFKLRTAKRAEEFVPRECSCTLCRKHRASWISDPNGEAHVQYEDESLVSSYRFGHRTADFIVCARCGVLMAATCELEGRTRAVLNTRTMPEGTLSATPKTTDFDAEDVEGRLARRTKNWTGNVVIG